MLPFDDLWPLLRDAAPRLPDTELATDTTSGRVLSRPPLAAWDLPRFDNSAMDGYAVRHADVAAASRDRPVVLPLAAAAAYAGPDVSPPLTTAAAIVIGTGGALPAGADTVVPREDTDVSDGRVTIRARVRAGQHVRRHGEELAGGQPVLPVGTRLNPFGLAALQAAGVTRVHVRRQPRIAIVVTGDELVPAGRTPAAGEIVETNGAMLAEALRLRFAAPVSVARVRDDDATLRATLDKALSEHDLVITTGGVSVGDRDHVKTAAEAAGAERLLWKVAMKPGKPLYVARRDHAMLVGLPGNPASAAVAFTVVLTPLLHAMEGDAQAAPRRLPAVLAQSVKASPSRTDLRWVRLNANSDAFVAEPLARGGSHMLSDLALAQGLAIVPPGDGELAAGARVLVIPFP